MKTLADRKPSLSFTIAPLDRDNKTKERRAVTITLPYEPLILRLDYPSAPENQTLRFMPIQKTTNSSLYLSRPSLSPECVFRVRL